jgi:N-acetylglucosamine kinase-like BadF-type ATPase
MMELYLGIHNKKSRTEAIVADRDGNVLGWGFNQTEQSDGHEGLKRALIESIDGAMKTVAMPPMTIAEFVSAHCVTNEIEDEEEHISQIVKAQHFSVGDDAPAALHGATGGNEGVVVIAGTSSVAYGEDGKGRTAKTGGWGHLFGDEGSGFWIASQAVRRAAKAEDELAGPTVLTEQLLSFFGCESLRELTLKVYADEITRDRLAAFAEQVPHAAGHGDKVAMQIIEGGARQLALLVVATAGKLIFDERIPVTVVGGIFRGKLTRVFFKAALNQSLPAAKVILPRFNPTIGALLLAYRQAGIELTERLLSNLEKGSYKE